MRLPNLSNTAKIGIGWTFCVSGGLYAFYLSKTHIDRTRYESMKVRERLSKVTEEEYTPVRNYKLPEIKRQEAKKE